METHLSTATERLPHSTVLTARLRVILLTVAAVLAVNLLIYALGRMGGGAFTYKQGDTPTSVDAVAVTILSVVPLTIGLTTVAWLSPRWPILITVAKIAAAVLAAGTIGLMTIPAHFDTISTLTLATMHLALIPAALLALRALTPPRTPRGQDNKPTRVREGRAE
jgi:Family of unknown function (DUF6069)